jgi:hypothetical protein
MTLRQEPQRINSSGAEAMIKRLGSPFSAFIKPSRFGYTRQEGMLCH